MGNLWCGLSLEERVIQNHHNDLQHVIIYPLDVASKLVQEGVVSRTLVSEVSTQGRSQLQNSTAIITAVTASIHSKPDQFQVFMSVLEDSPESANLARRMRNELGYLKPASGPTERLMERKGWWYTVPAHYKEDFIRLQGSFGDMFDTLCSTLRLHEVPVTALKEYLSRNFPDLDFPPHNITIDNVIETVRKNSSLTDLAYVKVISDHFNLQEMKQKIDDYSSKLDSFCEHTLDNHSYVRSFREDYPRYILSSEKLTFKLQWKANQKTLKDIRDVLQMSFGDKADRVQIDVIGDGSVVVVCCAPRYLMEELERLASESVDTLADIGVVELTVGGTEVINEKNNSSSFRPKKKMSSRSQETLATEMSSLTSPSSSSSSSSSDISQYEPSLSHFEAALVPLVTPSSRSSREKIKQITYFIQLSCPRGMVISQEGHLIVAERNKSCIAIINIDSGEVMKRFGKYGSGQGEFNSLHGGMALTRDGHLVVADTYNYRLQVLTVEGAFVAAVGSKGSQPLQFNQPYDVAVNHDGKIFVIDHLNHRVQVLNPDLSYSHCFGSKGDKPGELYFPRGIAIDQDGMVYVGDHQNYCIKKFTPEGSILALIEDKNTESRTSLCPHGLCFDCNGLLYVADVGSDVVCVYNTSGQFLGYIGNSDGSSFDRPHFIVSDKDRLYISNNNGVITYKYYQ